MTKRHRPRPPAPPQGGVLLNMPTQAQLDAAKRLSDAVALHLVADFEQAIRSVIMVKLEDGSTDGVLYGSWNDACANGAPDPRWYAPLRITPDGINERDALVFLRVNRDHPGIRMVRPTAPEHVVSPHLYTPGGRRLHP